MHVRRRAAALLAATGLTAALLPLVAGSAQADPSGPSYAYLNGNGLSDSSSDRLYATTSFSGSPLTLLTPNVHVFGYDISDDGNTLLVNGRSGSLVANPYNGTYGLLLVRRDPLNPSSVTTRSLSTWVDEVEPVLSADGAFAYWMEGGVLYRYSVLGGGNAVAVSTRFKPEAGEQAKALAISPDGTKAAAVYWSQAPNGEPTIARLKAAALATGVGPAYVLSAPYGSGGPGYTFLEWTADSSEVVFSRLDDGAIPSVQTYRVAPGGTPVALPALARALDLHLMGGLWYPYRSFGTYQLGTTADLATEPVDWTTFVRNGDRMGVVPSAVIPPATTTPVNRSRSTAYLYLSAPDILQGKSTGYASLATYLTDSTGLRTSDDLAQVRLGTLYSSLDGKTFTKLEKTYVSSALLSWPGGSKFGNGRITANRNTWLRWCFEGDVFATPDCSVTKKLTVHPYVSPTASFSGSSVRLGGSTSRKGGTAVLSKLVGGSYRVIASAPVTNTKRFTFGFRKLATGTYQISIKADASYGVGIARFRLIV